MPWHAKQYGGWTSSDTEGLDNAHMLFDVCIANGWSKQSVAAMLGNGAGESGLNPWRWEADVILASTDYSGMNSDRHGYGIFQFTPSAKYLLSSHAQSLAGFAPNFSDSPGNASDGNAQSLFMLGTISDSWSMSDADSYRASFAEYGIDSDTFKITYEEFKTGNYSLDILTGAYECRFEKPAAYYQGSNNAGYSYVYHRLPAAQSWWTIIQNWEGGSGGITDDDLLGWLMLKRRRRWWRK